MHDLHFEKVLFRDPIVDFPANRIPVVVDRVISEIGRDESVLHFDGDLAIGRDRGDLANLAQPVHGRVVFLSGLNHECDLAWLPPS